jgi:hypothetical protein
MTCSRIEHIATSDNAGSLTGYKEQKPFDKVPQLIDHNAPAEHPPLLNESTKFHRLTEARKNIALLSAVSIRGKDICSSKGWRMWQFERMKQGGPDLANAVSTGVGLATIK